MFEHFINRHFYVYLWRYRRVLCEVRLKCQCPGKMTRSVVPASVCACESVVPVYHTTGHLTTHHTTPRRSTPAHHADRTTQPLPQPVS